MRSTTTAIPEDQELDQFFEEINQEPLTENYQPTPFLTDPNFLSENNLTEIPEQVIPFPQDEINESTEKKFNTDLLLNEFKAALEKKDIDNCSTILKCGSWKLKFAIRELAFEEQVNFVNLVLALVEKKNSVFTKRFLNGYQNEDVLQNCLEKEKQKNDSSAESKIIKYLLQTRLHALQEIKIRAQQKKLKAGLPLIQVRKPRPQILPRIEEVPVEEKEEPIGPEFYLTKNLIDTLNVQIIIFRKLIETKSIQEIFEYWIKQTELFRNYFCGGLIEDIQFNDKILCHHFRLALLSNVPDIYNAFWSKTIEYNRNKKLISFINSRTKEERVEILEMVKDKQPVLFIAYIEKLLGIINNEILEECLEKWKHVKPEDGDVYVKKVALENKLLNMKVSYPRMPCTNHPYAFFQPALPMPMTPFIPVMMVPVIPLPMAPMPWPMMPRGSVNKRS